MATELQVDIVTPERSAYSGPATEVLFRAWEGEMGVYPDHDALLTLLRAGSCTVVSKDGQHKWVLGRGFAEVGATRVTILTDSCIALDEVDKQQATLDLTEADKAMAAADSQSERYRQAVAAAEHAQARLDS